LHAKELESELRNCQQLMRAGQFDRAYAVLAGLRSATEEASEEASEEATEVLYMLAVCCRYQGSCSRALKTLQVLKAKVPEHGRAHQEEGHTLRAMGRHGDALRAYSRACRCNPALLASWRAQEELLAAQGETLQMEAVAGKRRQMESLPKALLAVTDLIAQGRLLKAEDICRRFLQANPHHVEAMRLLAAIGERLGIYEDAELLLRAAHQLAPEHEGSHTDFIKILGRRQKFSEALEQAQVLLDTQPDNPRFQSLFAVQSMQAGDFDTALDYFEKILSALPGDAVTLTSRGHALKTRGESEAAVEAYREVLRANPLYGEAYHGLANLKTYRFEAQEIAAMQALENDPNLGFMDRVYLEFALGKAFEDRQNYDLSFKYYAAGNARKKSQSQYRHERMTEDLQAQRQVCNETLFEKYLGSGCDAPDPIFIVGLPRAGSTLLEQILSSHSQVDGTLELPNILSLSQRLRRRNRDGEQQPYPEILGELDAAELRKFGEDYLHGTRIHRQGAPFFIDKMPNNFRHIGLIKLILPKARIIDARRNPMACCFSGYKQLFAEGQEFSYSLEDIGHYYRDYVELMAHWNRILPGCILTVENEDLIEDFEAQVRRLLEFCQLPFEDSCLHYYATSRNVRTPSSEQVRRPISAAGVNQWRHYSEFLDPLRDALGPLQHGSGGGKQSFNQRGMQVTSAA